MLAKISIEIGGRHGSIVCNHQFVDDDVVVSDALVLRRRCVPPKRHIGQHRDLIGPFETVDDPLYAILEATTVASVIRY